MIIWRGYGIVVVLLAVLGMVVGQLGVEALPEGYRPGGAFVGMLLAAALVYGLHRLIDASAAGACAGGQKHRAGSRLQAEARLVLHSGEILVVRPGRTGCCAVLPEIGSQRSAQGQVKG
ncbi:hypothetical protein [Duganella sp. P38]|uniref:hypothetical protein n=1 Tax=Duganella sp. P38 TaxID=3423949 RepID=UPI003D7B7F30